MKPNFALALAPALLSFGPQFMVIGLRMEPPLIAYAGSVMLSMGLMIQFRMVALALKQLQTGEAQRSSMED